MIICHSRRFILFSNPKTGSESLRALFAPWSEEEIVTYADRTPENPFYSHMSPQEAEFAFDSRGLPFRNYVRITCVRNPYPRLVSLYRMIGEVDGLWKMRRQMGLPQPSFGRWLRSTKPYGRGGGGRDHQRWRRFGTWSAQHWCANRITHCIRLEHLEDDLEVMLPRLGIAPGSAPHLNRRDTGDWQTYYTPALAQLVANRYAWDLNQFGYEAPSSLLAAPAS